MPLEELLRMLNSLNSMVIELALGEIQFDSEKHLQRARSLAEQVDYRLVSFSVPLSHIVELTKNWREGGSDDELYAAINQIVTRHF